MSMAKQAGAKIRLGAHALTTLPWQVEVLLWLLVAAAAIAIRVYLFHLVPVYIWSKDSGSYLGSATQWLDTGIWRSDPRRGPIYSGFIALVLWCSPNLTSVVIAQHGVGVASVFLAAGLLRYWFGRAAVLPILFCTLCYAVYGLPIYLEHLIRNETILLFLSTLVLLALALIFARGGFAWPGLTGIFLALLNMTKKVFAPFPLIIIALLILRHRGDWRRAAIMISVFILGYSAPLLGNRLYRSVIVDDDGSGEYAGIQLYGRVAQWTWMEGGLYPEIKKEIAPLVIEYRAREKLDNNWVIKRGIVPRIASIRRKTPARNETLDTICKRLAFEAIRHHPAAYAGQVLKDLRAVVFELGFRNETPKRDTFPGVAESLREVLEPHAVLRRDEVAAVYDSLEPSNHRRRFKNYLKFTNGNALFEAAPPVLLTTLLFPVVFWFSPPQRRYFWAATACIWLFNIVLLSTVGRPMQRYLMPVIPIMFLCLSSAVILVWQAALALTARLPQPREAGT